MSDDEDDSTFQSLALSLRRKIDSAFDRTIISDHSASSRPSKIRKLNTGDFHAGDALSKQPGGYVIEEQGGFIVEDQPGGFIVDEPGGFIVGDPEAEDDATSGPTHIPLSFVPDALERLGLQPDDEEVLTVFRNAASGWGAQAGQEEGVSRKDWRAVCAVLLEVRQEGMVDEGKELDGRSAGEESGAENESDEYQASEDDESEPAEHSDDEDYIEGSPSVKTRTRKQQKGSGLQNLTADQAKECRRTFGLFFADVPDEDLDKTRLMIKDITRVAGVLKEKIKAEEIVEMLETFSTSRDKSMNLVDFKRMMLAARLV